MDNKSQTIKVCFASDNSYVMQLAASMASLLCNSGDESVHFYVLDDGISEDSKRKLASLSGIKPFELSFLTVDKSLFSRYPLVSGYVSITTYYRYMIATLVPDAERIVYLDCDVLVLDSLLPLWQTDLEDNLLIGVSDVHSHLNGRRLGFTAEGTYLNAGVLLMNLEGWRRENIEAKLFHYTDTNLKELATMDQDVINAVCRGRVKVVDDRWNCQYMEYAYRPEAYKPYYYLQPLSDPAIVHFIGKDKPWNPKTKAKLVSTYWRYVCMTPWKSRYTMRLRLRQIISQTHYRLKMFFLKRILKENCI